VFADEVAPQAVLEPTGSACRHHEPLVPQKFDPHRILI
jgi:hypothetical protein